MAGIFEVNLFRVGQDGGGAPPPPPPTFMLEEELMQY